jgi:hypothetical protein
MRSTRFRSVIGIGVPGDLIVSTPIKSPAVAIMDSTRLQPRNSCGIVVLGQLSIIQSSLSAATNAVRPQQGWPVGQGPHTWAGVLQDACVRLLPYEGSLTAGTDSALQYILPSGCSRQVEVKIHLESAVRGARERASCSSPWVSPSRQCGASSHVSLPLLVAQSHAARRLASMVDPTSKGKNGTSELE